MTKQTTINLISDMLADLEVDVTLPTFRAPTDLNTLARDLTLDEGLKVSLPEAQVKEVLACLGRRWRDDPSRTLHDAAAILTRAGLRSGKR